MTSRTTLLTAAILGALAVILGASGAHSLKPMLEEMGSAHTFELANRYHFYHVLALMGTGILMNFYPGRSLQWAAMFFLLGVVFFSGSLYALSFVKLKLLGPFTPVGGAFFIVGWVFLVMGIWRKK